MSSAKQPINPALLDQLRPVVRREQWRLVISFLAIVWIVLAIVGLLVFALNRSAESALDAYIPSAWTWLAGAGAIGTLIAIILALFSMPNAESMAHRVEEEFPDLDSVLLTAICLLYTSPSPRDS